MASTVIRHRFACDAETFWRVVIFDEEFNRRLYLDHLGFDGWELVRYEERDDAIERVVAVKPVTGPVPAPLKKLVGENIGYREEGRFDKKTERYRLKVVPNTMADKLTIAGEMSVKPHGDGVERTLDLKVEAKIFGVGGMVEKRIIADTEKSYDDSFGYITAELAKR